MDPESKKLLEDTFHLAEENNRMLRAMRRSMRMAHIMTFVYWVFIIGSAVGAYYFLQPYLEKLTGLYGGATNILNSFR